MHGVRAFRDTPTKSSSLIFEALSEKVKKCKLFVDYFIHSALSITTILVFK